MYIFFLTKGTKKSSSIQVYGGVRVICKFTHEVNFMHLLYFCEKSQDTFYKRHMRPGGQGTKPALSFQQGTKLFLLSTKSQRKEKKDIKGTPNHGHTFCREEAS